MITENLPVAAPAKPKKEVKPLTSRLRKSKNFWKEDRMLDDFIDRTKLIKNGEKRLIKKLIKLRSNEDSNEVKVTVTGLSKLLGVNVKTIRTWIKGLLKANFIIEGGNVWDPHCNFPKKKFTFPVTFPGFDLATVFIRKGAKVKYNAKQVQAEEKARQETSNGAEKPEENDDGTEKITSPIPPGLLNCFTSNEGETCNPFDSKGIAKLLAAKPEAYRRGDVFFSHELQSDHKISLLDFTPKFKELLITLLRQGGAKGKLTHLERLIEFYCGQNRWFKTPQDRVAMIFELQEAMAEQFFGQKLHGKVFEKLAKFIRQFIEIYTPPSAWNDQEFKQFKERYGYQCREHVEKFFKEYARIDETRQRSISKM